MTELPPVADRNRQVPPGVRLDLVDAVARIRFDRPPVNAFTVEGFRQFHAYLKQVGDDPRPVLLTGANGIFSAGFDIRQPGLDEAATVDAARDCLAAIQDHPAPVVAAVEGGACPHLRLTAGSGGDPFIPAPAPGGRAQAYARNASDVPP